MSSYLPNVTAQPQHLWDEDTFTSITEGNSKFAGAVKLVLKPKESKLYPESLTVFIFLGLASNNERTLQPWAGIYQGISSHRLRYGDSNKKKMVIGPNFSTLPEMREALSPSATNNLALPQTLTPKLEVEVEAGVKLPHVRIVLTLSTDSQSPMPDTN